MAGTQPVSRKTTMRLAAVLLCVTPTTSAMSTVSQAPPAAPPAILRGLVVTADTNAPFNDATVGLEPVTSQAPPSKPELPVWVSVPGARAVDSDGRFEIQTTLTGPFRLVATPGSTSMQYVQGRYPEPAVDAQPLMLTPGQILDDVVIVMPRGGVISGRVVDERGAPLSLVPISVREALAGDRLRSPIGLPATLNERTDDTGSFRIFGLRAGEYVIVAQPMSRMVGPLTEPRSVVTYPPTYYPGTLSASEATRITVRSGEEHGPIEFTLKPTRNRTIRGFVMDSSGAPVPAARIMVQKSSSAIGEGTIGPGRVSNSDGTFEIRDVPPGEYAVSAFRYGGATQEFGWTTVSGTADIDGLTLRIQTGVALEGQVTFVGTPPQSHGGLRVKPVRGAGASQSPSVLVSSEGTFALEHLFGPTLIRIEGLPRWHLKAVMYGDRDITDEPTEFVDGGPPLQVILTRGLAALTGVVRTDHGAAADATVVLLSEQESLRHERSTMTRLVDTIGGGNYRMEAVRAGRYLALAVPRDGLSFADAPTAFFDLLAKQASPVVIRDGESKTLDLTLTSIK